MQNEFTASAIAWGFSTYSTSKCSVKAFTSLCSDRDNDKQKYCESQDGHQSMYECSTEETLIVSQGNSFEIGLEFSPQPSYTGSIDEFISSFEKHKDLLSFDLQIQLGGGSVLRRETSDIQKRKYESNREYRDIDCTKFVKKTGGFYIGTTTSIRIPQEHVNASVQFILAVNLSIPESNHPSNHRHNMSSEELALRAILEGGRYRVPKIDPIQISLPAVIIDSLQVDCWSKSISPWNALLGVEISNLHPFHTILIDRIEVNLPGTLSVYDKSAKNSSLGHGSEENAHSQYTPCHPPVNDWLDLIAIPASTTSISNTDTNIDSDTATDSKQVIIPCGEAVTTVFKVIQKDAYHRQGQRHQQCEKFAQLLYGDIPPASLSGDFVTPVDIRWCELSQCNVSPLESSRDEMTYMLSTVPIYWNLDRRVGTEFVVDISGPVEGARFQPTTLKVLITNHTTDTRDVVVFLQDPSLAPVTLSSTPALSPRLPSIANDSLLQVSFLNHEISIPVRGLQCGEMESLSVVVYPLRTGQLDFKSIYIVDENSGEIFTCSCSFSMCVQ